MTRLTLGGPLLFLLAFSVPLMAQIQPIPNLTIQPVPIPGGDLVPGYGITNAFAPGPPGQTPPLDPIGAEPNVITNFKGLVAMGYTSGPARDSKGNQYVVITDIRVYKGAYRGGKAADLPPSNTAGATVSALSGNPDNYNDPENSVFVEIWLDLWDLSLSSQLHDFSPYLLPNGLFWTVNVPSSALTINLDGSITLHLVDVPLNDAFTFPPPSQAVPGISPVKLIPAKLSLDITYLKGGNLRHVRPGSNDPLSPFNWAGMMWDSTNSGTFSLSYDDGSFSASGSFASNGNFGEMGFEHNGVFVRDEGEDSNESAERATPLAVAPISSQHAAVDSVAKTERTVLLKGRVPIHVNE